MVLCLQPKGYITSICPDGNLYVSEIDLCVHLLRICPCIVRRGKIYPSTPLANIFWRTVLKLPPTFSVRQRAVSTSCNRGLSLLWEPQTAPALLLLVLVWATSNAAKNGDRGVSRPWGVYKNFFETVFETERPPTKFKKASRRYIFMPPSARSSASGAVSSRRAAALAPSAMPRRKPQPAKKAARPTPRPAAVTIEEEVPTGFIKPAASSSPTTVTSSLHSPSTEDAAGRKHASRLSDIPPPPSSEPTPPSAEPMPPSALEHPKPSPDADLKPLYRGDVCSRGSLYMEIGKPPDMPSPRPPSKAVYAPPAAPLAPTGRAALNASLPSRLAARRLERQQQRSQRELPPGSMPPRAAATQTVPGRDTPRPVEHATMHVTERMRADLAQMQSQRAERTNQLFAKLDEILNGASSSLGASSSSSSASAASSAASTSNALVLRGSDSLVAAPTARARIDPQTGGILVAKSSSTALIPASSADGAAGELVAGNAASRWRGGDAIRLLEMLRGCARPGRATRERLRAWLASSGRAALVAALVAGATPPVQQALVEVLRRLLSEDIDDEVGITFTTCAPRLAGAPRVSATARPLLAGPRALMLLRAPVVEIH